MKIWIKRNWHPILALCWVFFLVIVASFCTSRILAKSNAIQFDLQALLPSSSEGQAYAIQDFMSDAKLNGKIVLLIGHEDPEIAKKGLKDLRNSIVTHNLPITETQIKNVDLEYQRLFTKLFEHRIYLLSHIDRVALMEGQSQRIINRAHQSLSSPFGMVTSEQINTDPFLTYTHFVKEFVPKNQYTFDTDGNLKIIHQGKTWYLFQGQLADSGFAHDIQQQIKEKFLPDCEALKNQGLSLYKAGTVFYAIEGEKQAKNEISLISTISLLGIVALLMFVFRSIHLFGFSLVVIGSGLIGGLYVCLTLFHQVHILALVFGCSLVGVCVDYAIHYYCHTFVVHAKQSHDKFSTLKQLMPALPLGVMSSCLGYYLLSIVHLPGIKQMSVLAAGGILSAFISVVLWGPYLARPRPNQTPTRAIRINRLIQDTVNRISRAPSFNVGSRMVFILLVVLCVGVHFDDNVTRFQAMDLTLKNEQQQIQQITGVEAPFNYIQIEGETVESCLRQEEKITDKLYVLLAEKKLKKFQAISSLIPSMERQQENKTLLESHFNQHWHSYAESYQLPDESNWAEKNAAAKISAIPLLPEELQYLIKEKGKYQIETRIFLQQLSDVAEIDKITQPLENVEYIDPVGQYKKIFKAYRMQLMQLLAGIILVIFTGLSIMHRNLKHAFTILYPVLLSLVCSIAVLNILGSVFSLFHLMGLLLVLCIGVDYALFLYWNNKDLTKDRQNIAFFANGIAALTTLLSFGALAFSHTTAVSDFGQAVFVGISACFIFTSVLLGAKNEKAI